jgi:hypothetical protein
MNKQDNRISIKLSPKLAKLLRNIAFEKNKIYGGQGSITGLLRSVALKELLFSPSTADAKLPESSGIFFCFSEQGEILYIGKSDNLRHRWQNQNQELKRLLEAGALGIVWLEIAADTDEITETLVNVLHPMLNNWQGNAQSILKIPQAIKGNLANLASQHHKTDIANLLEAIANEQLMLFTPFTSGEQQALIRGISALIEKSDYADANLLLGGIMQFFDEQAPINEEIARLNELKLPWVQEVTELIEKRQSFQLSTDKHTYHCRYAEFWTAPVAEQRTYLRCWVENIFNSDEPPQLKHNRIFRLDKKTVIQTLPNTPWNHQGLDTIEVTLYLTSSFKYTPKAEDISCKIIRYQNNQYLEVIKKVNSVFWLFQTIQRYGDRAIVVSPSYVRERFVEQLRNLTRLYENFSKNPPT